MWITHCDSLQVALSCYQVQVTKMCHPIGFCELVRATGSSRTFVHKPFWLFTGNSLRRLQSQAATPSGSCALCTASARANGERANRKWTSASCWRSCYLSAYTEQLFLLCWQWDLEGRKRRSRKLQHLCSFQQTRRCSLCGSHSSALSSSVSTCLPLSAFFLSPSFVIGLE